MFGSTFLMQILSEKCSGKKDITHIDWAFLGTTNGSYNF